jgi:two-component system, NarL family, response regulator NreC
MEGTLRILLVDDHPLFRAGLRSILAAHPDLSIIGEAGDARQAYGVAETEQPDVIVMDLNLPGIDGVSAMRELLQRAPQSKVLMLSMYTDEIHAARALAAGASGYAMKTQSPDDLIEGVRTVARGERYLPRSLSPALLDVHRRAAARDGGPLACLSPREREIFGLLVRGLSNRSIAQQLCISVKTVETHRTHIHEKLGVHSIAQLIHFAAVNGAMEP